MNDKIINYCIPNYCVVGDENEQIRIYNQSGSWLAIGTIFVEVKIGGTDGSDGRIKAYKNIKIDNFPFFKSAKNNSDWRKNEVYLKREMRKFDPFHRGGLETFYFTEEVYERRVKPFIESYFDQTLVEKKNEYLKRDFGEIRKCQVKNCHCKVHWSDNTANNQNSYRGIDTVSRKEKGYVFKELEVCESHRNFANEVQRATIKYVFDSMVSIQNEKLVIDPEKIMKSSKYRHVGEYLKHLIKEMESKSLNYKEENKKPNTILGFLCQ